MKQQISLYGAIATIAMGAALVGCSDDAPSNTQTDAGADVATGSDVGSDATSSDASSDAADDGATTDVATADGGTDAAPVDAGSAKDCLDTTSMDPYFTLADDTKCLVAHYDVPTGSLSPLTWGRHGGPLGFTVGSKPTILRFEVPATATGSITIAKTELTISGVPAGAFWGGAVDLPFFGWTAISYTGMGTGFPGEVILVGSGGALVRYDVNGFFSAVGVSLASASGGRLIHTSLSPIASMPTTTNAGGLYAADSCGSASTSPRLLPGTDTSCKAPIEVATWEAGSSGPVAADPSDNVFAVLSKFGGKQELRGFERSTIARNAAPASGNTMFSRDGYTQELVATGKEVVFQAYDATTYAALDVEALAYTVDAAGKKITPGASKALLKPKTPGTAVTLVRDDLGRIWVGVAAPSTGDAGPTSSTFFVLRAKTP